MSNVSKKNSLAVAVALGLGLSAAAAAYTVQTAGDTDPVMVATADIVNASTDIGVNEATTIALTASDFILGRTTGFTIRVSLNKGAEFANGLTAGDLTVGAANGTWIPTIAAGGAAGDGFVVINMDPGAATALTTGDLLTINAAATVTAPAVGGLVLENLESLQTKGNTIEAAIQFVDPVTASAIMSPSAVTLLMSGDPVVLACDATTGQAQKRIDVGSDPGVQESKTYFSSGGPIGWLDSGYINLGEVSAEVATGFSTSFTYLATDEFVTVVTGDFSAFDAANPDAVGVFLSSMADCSTQDVAGAVSVANGTVTFEYTGADVAIAGTGFAMNLCAQVNAGNEVVIDDSNVSVVTTFSRGAVEASGAACNLLPLRYNGSVVEVYHVNPAGNTTAQSFVRVINPSDQGGLVTMVGIDDAGNVSPEVSFFVGDNASQQVNSDDLELGNPTKGVNGMWGNGTGKWRAIVTGEFAGMRVQAMNRNATDGTVTNLTDADGAGEQQFQSMFDTGEGF